jgi:hypothetical protein
VTRLLAHGDLVASLPLLVPPLIAVLVLGAVVWRDRRSTDDGEDSPLERQVDGVVAPGPGRTML